MAKTKIVVIQMKELIYTAIFAGLGILLIVLLIIMFLPDKSNKEKTGSTKQIYTPGVYTSQIKLGDTTLNLEVAVDADQRFLTKLTALLEENISNGDLSVDDVARLMGMSRSVYFKKIKALTGIGPNDYFKSLRLQKAAELLDAGELSITEISYRIGITDSHYFSKCFKQKFGVTPTEYRNR